MRLLQISRDVLDGVLSIGVDIPYAFVACRKLLELVLDDLKTGFLISSRFGFFSNSSFASFKEVATLVLLPHLSSRDRLERLG